MRERNHILRAERVSMLFRPRARLLARGRWLRALDDVTLGVPRGSTLGLVGESGSGKTTLGRCLAVLHRPTSGSVWLGEQRVDDLRGAPLKALRRQVQYVFQDPYASLDPRMKIGAQLSEPLAVHRLAPRTGRPQRVTELLERVGLAPDAAGRYPHEFSGGQRQRIAIARALAVEPSVLVADEPVSALDVSVQAQILNLLRDLRRDLGLTMVFISHDLHVVEFVSDRVAVMYLGRIVEEGTRAAIFDSPQHPYTTALLEAAPVSNPATRRTPASLPGEPPSPLAPPPGCAFHPRCPIARDLCRATRPKLEQRGEEHVVACHAPAPTGWET